MSPSIPIKKKYVVVELTVPAEENFAQANSRKSASILTSYTSARKQVEKWNTFPLKFGRELGLGQQGSPTTSSEAVSNTWTYSTKKLERQ